MLENSGLDPCALKHYIVLTVYLTGRAIAQFHKAQTWEFYYRGRLIFFAGSGLCLLAWLTLLRRRRRAG